MRWRDPIVLSTKFLIASVFVLCLAMALLGTWVSRQIERNVMITSGANGAAYLRATLEQFVQRIDSLERLHPADAASLDRLFKNAAFRNGTLSVKLWFTDGSSTATVIYSTTTMEIVGDEHTLTKVHRAWSGHPVAEFETVNSSGSRAEQSLQLTLIKIYAPLFRNGTNEVIAVGEVYHVGSDLAQHLRQAVNLTWYIVCLTTALMIAVLYLVVRRANRLHFEHQSALRIKVLEAEEMAAQNYALRLAADRSRLDANAANEQLLGRIGLDIHDGPVQFLTLLRFRIDEIVETLITGIYGTASAADGLQDLADKLSSVINELRDLSVGLVLPELDDLSLRQTLRLAVDRHEHLTATHVKTDFGAISEKVPAPIKTCAYRIVQEALSNSFKHADGHGLQVTASTSEEVFKLEIIDEGRFNDTSRRLPPDGTRLGQHGIRNRVAAFNGSVSIEPYSVNGTRVVISIPLS